MKKWLLCVVVLLAGCWDIDEPERMLYIQGIGVDYKDGEYIGYAQIINFQNIAKTDQPNNPDAVQVEIGSAKGNTFSEAFYRIYDSLDQRLFWGHFSYVLLSENVLKDGKANGVINTITRFQDTRYNGWVYSTKEDVKDVLLTMPILNKAVSSSKLSDPYNRYQQSSLIEPINLRKFIIHMNEPNHMVKIPLITINKKWETPQQKEQLTKLDGVAVVTPDELKGFLENEKVQGLQWLTNESVRSTLTITTEQFKDQRISIAMHNLNVKVIPVVTGNQYVFDIEIEGVAFVISFDTPQTTANIKKAVSAQIEQDVRATFEAGLELNTDVYRLSEKMYRTHLPIWQKYAQEGQLPLQKDSIREIRVNVSKVNVGRKSFEETIE